MRKQDKVTKRARPVDVHVGARVRMRRMMLGLSQSELGDACKLTFQQIQKYEKGTNRIGSSRLAEIAATLKVSPGFFFEGLAQTPLPSEAAAELTLVNSFLSTKDGLRLARSIVQMPPAMRLRFVDLADMLAGPDAKIPQAI